MNRIYDRICWMLAASGLSQSDLVEVAEEIAANGSAKFAKDILSARRTIEGFKPTSEATSTSFVIEDDINSEVYAKVRRLLIQESELSQAEAARAIQRALNRRHPELKIPPLAKRSLASWLMQISRVVSPSELLHVVTTIRNEVVHDVHRDWRLK